MESTTFDIDNMPPVVTVTGVRREGARTIVAFDVRDADSAVQKAEYLARRRPLADDLSEGRHRRLARSSSSNCVLEGDTAARGVIIRATDALNNVTSARGEAPAAPARR